MKTKSFFVIVVLFWTSQTFAGADSTFSGQSGQDTVRLYGIYSGVTDTNAIGYFEYGPGFIYNSTDVESPKQLSLGSGQVEFLLTGQTAGDYVSVHFCIFAGGMPDCSPNDTVKMTDPVFATTIDLINVVVGDSLKWNYILTNNDPTLYLIPIGDDGLAIDASPYWEGDLITVGVATAELKYFMTEKFPADTYALCIRYINDLTTGASDTIPKIIQGMGEQKSNKLLVPKMIGNRLVVDLGKEKGKLFLSDITGRKIGEYEINQYRQIGLWLLKPGVYLFKVITENGETSGEIVISR